MNAIIVELKGAFAAALSDDGSVVRIANHNYVIGQVIEMKKMTSTKQKMLPRIIAVAASLVLFCGIGGGAFAYLAPTSYVSLDVNPSIEYTLNMFDRVLSVHAVNEDGAQILQEVNLKDFNNKTIDEAIALTLTEITKEGYFAAGNEGGIVIATSGKDHAKAERLAEQLGQSVKAQCAENKNTVKVETLAVDQVKMDEAKAMGTTPGKLALIQELQEHYTGTEPFDAKAWLAKPVKDIMAEVERTDDLDDLDDKDDLDDADDKDDLDDADDAKDDLDDAAEDAEDAAKDAAEDAAEAKEKAEDAAKEKAEDAQEAKDEAADQADDKDDDKDDDKLPVTPAKAPKAASAGTKPADAPDADEPEDTQEEAEEAAEEAEEAEEDKAENQPKPEVSPKPQPKPEASPKPEVSPKPVPTEKPQKDTVAHATPEVAETETETEEDGTDTD